MKDRILAALTLLILTGLIAGPALSEGLVITRAVEIPGESVLLIVGQNFGDLPRVFIGNNQSTLDELVVLVATPTNIEAQLPGTDPGTYLLVVQRGVSDPATTMRFDPPIGTMSLTLGAVGPGGPEGPPGPTTTEVVRGELVVITPGGNEVATVFCAAGQVATGGGFDLSNQAAIITSSAPNPAVSGAEPTGWIVGATNTAAFDIGLTALVVCAPAS